MNVDGIKSFVFGLGFVILVAGIGLALYIGFRYYLIPPNGIIPGDGFLHPLRWWFAGGVFLLTLTSSGVLLGVAGIIGAVQENRLFGGAASSSFHPDKDK